MKLMICLLCFLFAAVFPVQANEQEIEQILNTLTLQEKLSLCYGDGGRSSKAIPEKGIPRLRMHNGPRGARCMRQKATSFPCGTAMASSWSTNMVYEMAAAIGAEMYAKGGNILLAPAINIQRDPLGGRTFEYLTEDPYLNARLTVAFVKGAQNEGVACNLKHFVANNQDNNRNAVNSEVSERALREIYFPAFKAGVMEGGAWTVMTAANRVNGLYASDSKWLLNDVLKKEWGFDGLVLTDWCEARSGALSALAGLDLSMPGRSHNPFNKQLAKDVADGKVPESVIDEMVRRLLRTAFRTHMLGERPEPRLKVSAPETAKLARKVAAECMVLLKNDKNLLPLNEKKIKTIALFGPNVDYRHNLFGSGGGSSNVESEYYITPIAGLKERFGEDIEIIFDEEYCKGSKTGYEVISEEFFQTEDGKPGLRAEYFNNPDLKGKPVIDTVVPEINFLWEMGAPDNSKMKRDNYSCRWTGYLVPPEDGLYSIKSLHDDGARVWIDDHPHMRHWIKKGFKEWAFNLQLEKGRKYKFTVEHREIDGDATMKMMWSRPFDEKQLEVQLAKVAEIAGKADVCLFFGGLNNIIETEGHDRENMNLTTHQAEMIRAVQRANPNTVVVLINGSPVKMRDWIDQVPAVLEAWYPGQESGRAICDILFGDVNPSGKLPITFPKKLQDGPAYLPEPELVNVKYHEGVLVGYRWYDTKKIEPEFCFGHGLSYTTFDYSNLNVAKAKDGVRVSFDLKNSGKRDGAEVAQVYVRDVKSSVIRPIKELKGFSKVTLPAGKTETVTALLKKDAFQFWDEKTKDWKAEPGEFEILVGSSSRDIRLRKSIQL